MYNISELRYYMDETSSPYDKNEVPITRTKEDEDFEKEIIKKYNLVLNNEI